MNPRNIIDAFKDGLKIMGVGLAVMRTGFGRRGGYVLEHNISRKFGDQGDTRALKVWYRTRK